MATSLEEIKKSIEPIIVSLNYSLWAIEMIGKKNGFLVRIYIDCKDRSITVADCEKVTKQLIDFFEAENFQLGDYILEVSSPGLDRSLFELKHYQKMQEKEVQIVLFNLFEGKRTFTGFIKGTEGSNVVLIIDNEELSIPFNDIKKAKIVPDYNAI